MKKVKKALDRRTKQRFPIHRELRYKVLDEGVIVASGTGQTVNMGSRGVAFSTDRDLHPGAYIELSISWPALLDGACPLRMIVFGRVLRSSGSESVCTVDKHEFRTQARNTLHAVAPARQDSMLQRWAGEMQKESVRPRAATA